MVNIEGLNPAAVCAALYNAARPQGMGFLHYNPSPWTPDNAQEFVGKPLDYLFGRAMKLTIDPNKTEFNEGSFDRDNGIGAAQMVIDSLRQTGDPNNEGIQAIHAGGVEDAAVIVKDWIAQDTTTTDEDGTAVILIGGTYMAAPIREALKRNGLG